MAKNKKEVKIVKIEDKEEKSEIVVVKKELTEKIEKNEESINSQEGCSCEGCGCSVDPEESDFYDELYSSDYYEEFSCEQDFLNALEENFRDESTFSEYFGERLDDESDIDLDNIILPAIGLDNDELNKLNRFKYSQMITNFKTCCICYSDFNSDDTIIELKCLHIYHISCIIQWLINNKDCPYCKTKLG